MNRKERATLAQETLDIIERGFYVNSSGQRVEIATEVQAALAGTKLYRPDEYPTELALSSTAKIYQTTFAVTDETTLGAARRLHKLNETNDLVCLNFASAKNPGGGFLGGSQAQEESLARSSALYPCQLTQQEMYDYNRRLNTCLYSDYMIFSPDVPVLRDDDGVLLEEPYSVSFITAPAVNAGAVRRNESGKIAEIRPTMLTRLQKVLWIAQQNGQKRLVLGAWGCGVFANDTATVADIFSEALHPHNLFGKAFKHVTFAVYDKAQDQPSLTAFKKAFSVQTL